MANQKKSAGPVKRIPIGTEVKFSTLPGFSPERVGVVVGVPSEHLRAKVYTVRVDKTPTGKPKATPEFFHPYASRLEAQNPKALKKA